MTHIYSAGNSRRAAVFTAIIGLHVAVLLVVLNDQFPGFADGTRKPGPITVLPPKPLPPVIVPLDKLPPAEPSGLLADEPILTIPDFPEHDELAPPLIAGGDFRVGTPTLTQVDRAPASLQSRSSGFADIVRACYPAAARRAGEEGRLILAVTIDAQGRSRSWRLAESSGFSRLDAAARCVLDKLGFNAAREDGRAVESEVLLPITFRLD